MGAAIRRCACCLLLGAACQMAGRAAEVQWDVRVGFEGLYKRGAWVPISVAITNKGESQSGRIVVPVTRSARGHKQVLKYVVPVELPQNSRKLLRLYVPSERLSHAALYLGSEREARELRDTREVAAEDTMVVVVTENLSLLGFLKGAAAAAAQPAGAGVRPFGPRAGPSPGWRGGQARIQVAHALWGGLPESWLGWDGVDAVVLASTRFAQASQEEIEALAQWVKLGGTLVVPGGALSPAMAGGPLGKLLPMQVTGTRTAPDLQPLAAWVGQPLNRQAVLLAAGRLRPDAAVLCGSREEPLVVSRPVGGGRVIMTTFDFAAEPVKYWDGQIPMWRRMLAQSISEESVVALAEPWPGYYPGFSLGSAAAYTAAAEVPPMWLMIGFLLAYIIVLVPVNYVVVNRLGRRELAWLTTPAIIAVFSFGAYGAGYALRGGQTLLNRLGVIEVGPGTGFARGVGYAGIFSPAKMKYELLLEGTAAAARDARAGGPGSSEQLTVVYGPQTKVTDLAVNMWSTRAVCVDFLADLGKGISGHFEYDGSDLRAKVKNETGMKLSKCRIVRESREGKRVDIGPGDEAELSFIQTSAIGPTGPPGPSAWRPEARLEDRAVEALFGEQARIWTPSSRGGYGPAFQTLRPYLVAVCEEPLVPVSLAGKRAKPNDKTILIVRLPLRLAGGKLISVPDWAISPSVTATQGSVQSCPEGHGHRLRVNVANGEAVVEFVVPLGEAGGEVSSLALNAYHGGAPGRGTRLSISAFNFSTNRWEELRRTSQRINLPRPAQFMAEDGRVRFRLTASPGQVDWHALNLAAEVRTY